MSYQPTDEILIHWAKNGRAAGFDGLVRRYERLAFTLAMRVVGRREEAEEIAQDAFLKAFRGLADWRGDCKFSTWLYQIVYRTALNTTRKNTLETRSLDAFERPLQVADGTQNALENLEKQAQTAQIEAILAEIAPDDAAILTLFYLNEQSLAEIGEILQIDPNTAKVRLCRARTRMRQMAETMAFQPIF
jgi:RNA polymerase sigma factor (sigma-70 family)